MDVKVRGQHTLLLVALMEQVVDCSYLVMFVVVQTLLCIVSFEPKLFKHLYYLRFHWDYILANDKTLVVTNWLINVVPLMFLDVLGFESSIWISIQDVCY
jgi:hypothetical protein